MLMRRAVLGSGGVVFAGMTAEAVMKRYRATHDREPDALASSAGEGWKTVSPDGAPDESLLSNMASNFTMRLISCTGHLLMNVLNDFEIQRGEVFREAHANRSKVPLLTVANHTSTLDDPMLLGALIPLWDSLIDPTIHRWSICREEVCYKRKVSRPRVAVSRLARCLMRVL